MIKGIYAISCIMSKYRYIGSTINFDKRKKEHLTKLKNQTHPNSSIQSLYNNYPSSIRIEMIDTRNDLTRNQIYDLEQAYINAEKLKLNKAKYTSYSNSEGRVVNKLNRRRK